MKVGGILVAVFALGFTALYFYGIWVQANPPWRIELDSAQQVVCADGSLGYVRIWMDCGAEDQVNLGSQCSDHESLNITHSIQSDPTNGGYMMIEIPSPLFVIEDLSVSDYVLISYSDGTRVPQTVLIDTREFSRFIERNRTYCGL